MTTHRLCIAPMMGYSDRHFRYLCRLLAPASFLYTEMITAASLVYNPNTHHRLGFNAPEHPVALQLGSDNPEQLAACAQMPECMAFDEINLNIGCPSERVQSGAFGACLMARPERVAECIRAMRPHTDLPITVKTRIGIDHQDDEAFLRRFIDIVAESGCNTFIIHARKAWLKGLSPHQNRTIPPLHYDRVYRIKALYPDLKVIINGGITDPETVIPHTEHCDGVMIGRLAYLNPLALNDMHNRLFPEQTALASPYDLVLKMIAYAEREVPLGSSTQSIFKHCLGLFRGLPGAKQLRGWLCEQCRRFPHDIEWTSELADRIKQSQQKA